MAESLIGSFAMSAYIVEPKTIPTGPDQWAPRSASNRTAIIFCAWAWLAYMNSRRQLSVIVPPWTLSMYSLVTNTRTTSDSSIPLHMASRILPFMCVSSNQTSTPRSLSTVHSLTTRLWLSASLPQLCDAKALMGACMNPIEGATHVGTNRNALKATPSLASSRRRSGCCSAFLSSVGV